MNNRLLHQAYADILKGMDSAFLDVQHPASKVAGGLSGLFLPSVSPDYHQARNRIMIVGRETRGWSIKTSKNAPFDLDSYIESAIFTHQSFFQKQLDKKNSKGRAFHNFTRSIAKKCGTSGLIYSNLFCFSWKKGNPKKHPDFETIKHYSKRLLDAQIEILKPQIIVFCNGSSSAGARREFFPVDGNAPVCSNFREHGDSSSPIPNRQLWEFTLNDSIRCFRVQHPSSRSQETIKAHKYLIKHLLPSA